MEIKEEVRWKRILKLGISVGVFLTSEFIRAVRALVGMRPKTSCIVLYYHSVPATERRLFARQLDILLRRASPLAAISQNSLVLGRHHAVITFDDGFTNFAEVALPELAARKLHSTVFVIVEALGKAFGPASGSEAVMSLPDLLALPRDLVTLGSHTLTHPMLTKISREDARSEIATSRVKLEELLGCPVRYFSFPFGDFDETLVGFCREAGYEHIFTTQPVPANVEEFAIGRVRVDPTDWDLEFRLKLAGAYCWLPMAFVVKRSAVRFLKLFGRTRNVREPGASSMIRDLGPKPS